MDTLRGNFADRAEEIDDLHAYDTMEIETGREAPPANIGVDERRMQVRAYNHWASLLEDRNFPGIEDLEPEALPDFGPYSVLLDFSGGIEDPGVAYLGNELAKECGTDGNIQSLSDVPSRSLLSRITDHYMQILANQAPIGFEAEFVNQRGSTILYRGILLPFSSDDDTIDFIYGVINWKEMADQQTTDELLLEIDQALETDEPVAPRPADPEPVSDWADGPAAGIIEPANEDDVETEPEVANLQGIVPPLDTDEDGDSDLPKPSFGFAELNYSDDEDDEDDEESTYASLASLSPSLKTPIIFDGEDSGEAEAEAEAGEGENALEEALIPIPPAEDAPMVPEWQADEVDQVRAPVARPEPEDQAEEEAELAQPTHEIVPPEIELPEIDESEMGLGDWLASARELADAARSSEDRTRTALYEAIGKAYDFSLAAGQAPEEFHELLSDSGLTVQERAPMTPVVKLVFGVDYDKTRVTEYASALSHAHRLGLERGGLATFLRRADGGLKGVVRAERRLRKEESGRSVEPLDAPRKKIARKLRRIQPRGFEAISADGQEFALVMIRRTEDGQVVMLGEIPDDVALIEKAAKKLLD